MPGYRKEDLVDNAIFRDLVINAREPLTTIARRMEIDEASLRRSIGTKDNSYRKHQKKCSRDMAVRICRAVNADLVEFGL
jgi:hypothetical protein